MIGKGGRDPVRTSERELYENEADIRPNRYVAVALAVLSFFIIGMLLLNEIDVFLVVKTRMRFCAFSALIILEIPLFAASTDAGLKNPRTKYVMILCASAVSVLICTVLNFHATLTIALPILLAAQYPSVKTGRIAMFCSLFCAFVSPVLGYLTGTWDLAFIERLNQFVGRSVIEAVGSDRMDTGTAVLQILLYLSIPHTLITLAFYPLSRSIARSGEARLKSQIRVLHMGQSDALTGLLNRLSFEETITKEITAGDGSAAVVFFDANGLHRLNNEQGHIAGDRMLICVAQNLQDIFGDENVFRTGGDEFVAVLRGVPLPEARDLTDRVCTRVEQAGYSVSAGLEFAQAPCTLPALVTAAETKMMIDKARYHITR